MAVSDSTLTPTPKNSGLDYRSQVSGEYEIVNSHQVVMSFSMGSDFTGTPVIGLVAPGKGISLNWLRLYVNRENDGKEEHRTSLDAVAPTQPMFLPALSVTEIKPLGIVAEDTGNGSRDEKYGFQVLGVGFRKGDAGLSVSLNGVLLPAPSSQTVNLCILKVSKRDVPKADQWLFTFQQGTDTFRVTLDNPTAFRVGASQVVAHRAVNGGTQVVVKVSGTGFQSGMTYTAHGPDGISGSGDAAVNSDTEAMVELTGKPGSYISVKMKPKDCEPACREKTFIVDVPSENVAKKTEEDSAKKTQQSKGKSNAGEAKPEAGVSGAAAH